MILAACWYESMSSFSTVLLGLLWLLMALVLSFDQSTTSAATAFANTAAGHDS